MMPECVTNFARIFQVMIGTLLPPLIVGDVTGNFLASEAALGIATEVTLVPWKWQKEERIAANSPRDL